MEKKITNLNAFLAAKHKIAVLLETKNKRDELLKRIDAISLKIDAMHTIGYWAELRKKNKPKL
jgi:hypothetical protein